MAEQAGRGRHPDIHARVLKQNAESISPSITVGTQLLESRDVPVGMRASNLGVSLPHRIGPSLYMPGELLNQLFEFHHQPPFWTFSRANNPNLR